MAEQARTTHKAAEKAHEAVDNIEQLAEQMEERFRQLADDIKEQTRQSVDAAQQKSQQATRTADQYIHQHPYASLGIAFLAGVVVSSLLKQK